MLSRKRSRLNIDNTNVSFTQIQNDYSLVSKINLPDKYLFLRSVPINIASHREVKINKKIKKTNKENKSDIKTTKNERSAHKDKENKMTHHCYYLRSASKKTRRNKQY